MLASLLSAALAASPSAARRPSPTPPRTPYDGEVTFTAMVEIADDAPDFVLLPSYINRQLLYLVGPLQAAPRKDGARRLVVRRFWGVTNIGEDSVAFFCMAKEAAEPGSVFLYSGHSRVGLLDLAYMGQQIGAPIRMNFDRYQIFGLFGCLSYSFYKLYYFAAKATPPIPRARGTSTSSPTASPARSAR